MISPFFLFFFVFLISRIFELFDIHSFKGKQTAKKEDVLKNCKLRGGENFE